MQQAGLVCQNVVFLFVHLHQHQSVACLACISCSMFLCVLCYCICPLASTSIYAFYAGLAWGQVSQSGGAGHALLFANHAAVLNGFKVMASCGSTISSSLQ